LFPYLIPTNYTLSTVLSGSLEPQALYIQNGIF